MLVERLAEALDDAAAVITDFSVPAVVLAGIVDRETSASAFDLVGLVVVEVATLFGAILSGAALPATLSLHWSMDSSAGGSASLGTTASFGLLSAGGKESPKQTST